jgi:hypothetical protein
MSISGQRYAASIPNYDAGDEFVTGAENKVKLFHEHLIIT